MIEKFNFYDVYGYFVPGAAFITILWVPFGVVKHSWSACSWSGAIIAVVLAYIVGHLIQSLATNALPSSGRGGRFPSETYLDATDTELPEVSKRQIQKLMKQQFGLELEVEKVGDEALDKVRHNAFLLARQILIQGKAVSYAEQFQGMYAMTRGLVLVLALGFAYWLGFGAAAILRDSIGASVTVVGLAISLLVLANVSLVLLRTHPHSVAKHRKMERAYAVALAIAFCFLGYALGLHYQVSERYGALLAFLSGWALIASLRVYGAYMSFAGQFAATVWRDYLAYSASAVSQEKPEHAR